MANNENLIVPTSEEARENGRKGGIASGIARRQKKSMAEKVAAMLEYQPTKAQIKAFKKVCVTEEDQLTLGDMIIAGQAQSAMQGNTKAFNALMDLNEKANKKTDNSKYELPARVIAESFVKINRKMLSEIAISNPEDFAKICEQAKAAK